MQQNIKVYNNVLDAKYCADVSKQLAGDSRITDDPQPDYSRRKYLNISECNNLNSITMKFVQVANELAEDYFMLPQGMEEAQIGDWLDDGFIFAHYKKGDDLSLHVDGQSSEHGRNGLRLATVLFFLNTADGGALNFPLQSQSVKPVVGSAVVFPVGFTHPHSVDAALSDRFILQTWLTDPRYVVNDA